MKELARSIYVNPKYSFFFRWWKLITFTGSSQLVVQVSGMIIGILIIRLLPTKEYALYTLANTMLGTMTLLADGGISTGVMAEAGKVWNDPQQLGSVIVTGLELRKKFAVISLIIAIPVLLFLLRQHDASWLFAILIILSLIPAFIAALSDSLLEVSPKLHQDIKQLQKNQMAASIGRFLMVGLLIIFPWTFVAIIGNGLPRLWANKRLRQFSIHYTDYNQKSDTIVRKKILNTVAKMLPGIIYYCISGQLTIWLISAFGSTKAVAQVGALGRLIFVMNIFVMLFQTLLVPRFAKLTQDSDLLLKRFLQIEGLILVVCAIVTALFWLFPTQIIWILGEKYTGLGSLLKLNIISSCIGLIVGTIFTLYSSRGWIIFPWLSIPIDIIILIIGILVFNISTVEGVFKFNIFVNAAQLVMHFSFAMIKIKGISFSPSRK